jgi:hypothetical protein
VQRSDGGQAVTPTTPRAALWPWVPPTTAEPDLLWRGAALVAEWIERNPERRLSVDEAIDLVVRVVTEWPLHRLLSDGDDGGGSEPRRGGEALGSRRRRSGRKRWSTIDAHTSAHRRGRI